MAVACAWASQSLAGRPLNVDDASVNEPGAGQIETWYAKQPGGARVVTVAPAWSPLDGLEIGAALARDTAQAITSSSVQAKFRITPSREGGCNLGAVLGAAHEAGQRGAAPWVTGLLTCNIRPGALHLNLGASRAPGGPTLPGLGLAWEQDLGGATGHVEWQAQRQTRPTLGLGLRKEVFRNFQIDGSFGRQGGGTLFSLGVTLQFP